MLQAEAEGSGGARYPGGIRASGNKLGFREKVGVAPRYRGRVLERTRNE